MKDLDKLEWQKLAVNLGIANDEKEKRIQILESGLKELQSMVDDRESMQTLGLMMLGPISRKIKQLIETK